MPVSQPPRDVPVDPTVSVDPPVVGLTAVDVSVQLLIDICPH